ncbi:unnamed protein product [Parnassius apollo]|uniref:(apollo) hypothetical protein n=1 Tax=Parnassius apollo TaxID=110799 RepID=A0A8S3XAF1_PARAO|nr:unnamed protein product [Parnassius apollo]
MLLATIKKEIEKQNDKQTQTITETISKTIEEQLLPIKKENEAMKINEYLIELFNVPCTTEQAEEEKHDWDKWELSSIYRVGKKTDGKIRPIKISCTTWRRNEILKKKKKFSEGVYVTEDLSKEELEERKTLIPKMKEARVSGKYAIIRNGKLIIRDKMEPEKEEESPIHPTFYSPRQLQQSPWRTQVIPTC